MLNKRGSILLIGFKTTDINATIIPGEIVSLGTIYYRSTGENGEIDMNLDVYQSESILEITDAEWAIVEQAVRPDGFTDNEWTRFWSNLRNRIDNNWGALNSFFNHSASLLELSPKALRNGKNFIQALYDYDENFKASSQISGTVSNAEFQHLKGVTSAIQTQINSKQGTLTPGTGISISSNIISLTPEFLGSVRYQGTWKALDNTIPTLGNSANTFSTTDTTINSPVPPMAKV